MSKIYHNTELAILSAIQLRSTGGEWAARPDENGVKNIEVYDFKAMKRVPFVGDYIHFKLAIIRKYEWKGEQREDAGLYGQEIFFDLPINDLYANEKGRYEGLLNAIVPQEEAGEGDFVFTQGFAFKNISFDATLTEGAGKTGKVYYNIVRIEDAGKAKPPTRLDVTNIKQSSNTASVLQAILAKRNGSKAQEAAPTPEKAIPVAEKPSAITQDNASVKKADDIPWA